MRLLAALSLALVMGCSDDGGAPPPPPPPPTPTDTVPPTVTATSPLDGAADVPTLGIFSVTFSEDIHCPSGSAADPFRVRQDGGAPEATWFDCDGSVLTFTLPERLTNGVVHTLQVEGMKDLALNPMAAPYSWSFTTAQRPRVTGTTPALDATGLPIALAAIEVTFSKALDCNSAPGAITVQAAGLPVTGTTTCAETTLTFAPDHLLPAGTLHTARVGPVGDTAGEVSEEHTWSFTTAPPPPAPTGLTAQSGNGHVTLGWTPVEGAASYDVYFAEAPGVTPEGYAALTGGGKVAQATSPLDHARPNGTIVRYVVTASGPGGEGPPSDELAVEPVAPPAWAWVDPWPTGATLNAVEAVSADEAWAVGEGGTLVHTGDAGATWDLVEVGTSADLSSVARAGLRGWATGAGGLVLHTENAGATWQAQAGGPVQPGSWAKLDFVDETTGWVLWWPGQLLHTTDAGRSWAPQALPYGSWGDVHFRDALHGVVSGERVLATSDGGATWQDSGLEQAASWRVAFGSSSAGVALAISSAQLAYTTNGGATWRPSVVNGGGYLYGVAMGSAQVGWAVGAFGVVLATSDGGATWAPQSTPTTQNLWDVAAVDALHAWAVGNDGTILRTADGGASWTVLGRRAAGDDVAVRVSFGDTSHGLAVAGSRLIASGDGGATWELAGGPANVFDVQLLDATGGFLVTQRGGTVVEPFTSKVFHTADGGWSWEERGTIAEQVSDAHFVDGSTGWLVGAAIWRTTDGGASYLRKGASAWLLGVRAANASRAWVTGTGGFVASTDNGGETWTPGASGTPRDLWTLAALDGEHAWVAGGNSSGVMPPLLSTEDGGATWTPHAVAADIYLQAMAFADVSHGWVVGPGTLLATVDGGATWQRQRVPFGMGRSCYDLAARDADHAWLACRGLLRTTTGGR